MTRRPALVVAVTVLVAALAVGGAYVGLLAGRSTAQFGEPVPPATAVPPPAPSATATSVRLPAPPVPSPTATIPASTATPTPILTSTPRPSTPPTPAPSATPTSKPTAVPTPRPTVAPTATPVPKPPAPPAERAAVALYYPWFDLEVWKSGVTVDQPSLPYNSADPAVIRRHVSEAKAAGLTALVSAYSSTVRNDPTEENLPRLLDEAGRQGLKVAALFETNAYYFSPNLESQKAALRKLVSTYAKHPAYLKIQGKPPIFVWRPRGIFQDGKPIDRDGAPVIAAWRAAIGEVDPGRSVFWIAEGDHFPLLEVFDGIFPYSIAWSSNPAAQLQSYASSTRTYPGKLWFATAMPGYDDTRSGYAQTFKVDRENGAYYQRSLAGALATNPDGLIVVSYNEWVEGHAIESGAKWGDLYLRLTRTAVDGWRSR